MALIKKMLNLSFYFFMFLLVSLVIYYDSININLNLDFYLKILLLLTASLCFIVFGFKKYSFIVFTFVAIMYILSIIGARWSEEFTLFESVTAIASLSLGVIISQIKWNNVQKLRLLQTISLLPLISIIIGLTLWPLGVLNFLGRNNTALAGASLSTNLSFFGVIGIMSSLHYFYKTNNTIYRYLAYLNFVIVFLTLTRGGILAGFIVLVPDFIRFIKSQLKSMNKKQLTITSIIFVIALIPIGIASYLLLERSFVDGEFISSGRFTAWPRILEHVTNIWIGRGYGYLKTVTDPALKYFIAAHNEYIRLYLETGIIGLILFTIILFIIFYHPLKKSKGKFKILYTTVIISFLVYSLVDNTLTNFRYFVPFMAYISVLE